MGILNVTPDSFSDGGQNLAPQTAIEAALQMQADGADIIDIGGESTRPYSERVPAAEELSRVMPVIEGLAGKLQIPLSIDTSKAEVARAATQAGAEIINDVSGLEGDPDMPHVAVQSGVGVCVMHMRGTPQTMQDAPEYDNVVAEIHDYLLQRRQHCQALGIPLSRVCLDPGIGFGKTHEHNLELLRATKQFTDLNCPILIGHSRKGFIGKVLGDQTACRTAATVGVSLAVAAAGAHVVRVHDVRETVHALKLFEAAGGLT
ncbi:MAG: dihydropteroate synthase [Pirellulales bacterium]|nr:dihydropteroate synthase [Pirellulales bacterium]